MSTEKTNFDSEATRLQNEDTRIQNEDTRVQDFTSAAPVSKKKMANSPWASRLGIGIGSFVAGGAAGFGVSAMASGSPAESGKIDGLAADSTLSEGATPESELNEADVDSTLSNREKTTLDDDPYELSNSTSGQAKITEVEIETPAQSSAAAASNASAGHIISDNNPVINPAKVDVAEVTVTDTEAHHANTVVPEIEAQEVELSDVTVPDAADAILVNENGIKFAHVDDDMSFAQAFAAAREQVGAGGAFEWHGNVYGTYYEEEWADMSGDDRSDFMARVTFPEHMEEIPDVPDYPEVTITGFTSTTNDAGTLIHEATLEIDGNQFVIVDADGDGVFDAVLVDVDGDHDFSVGTDAILPIHDAGLSVQDVVMAMTEQNGYAPDVDINLMGNEGDDMAMTDFANDSIPEF